MSKIKYKNEIIKKLKALGLSDQEIEDKYAKIQREINTKKAENNKARALKITKVMLESLDDELDYDEVNTAKENIIKATDVSKAIITENAKEKTIPEMKEHVPTNKKIEEMIRRLDIIEKRSKRLEKEIEEYYETRDASETKDKSNDISLKEEISNQLSSQVENIKDEIARQGRALKTDGKILARIGANIVSEKKDEIIDYISPKVDIAKEALVEQGTKIKTNVKNITSKGIDSLSKTKDVLTENITVAQEKSKSMSQKALDAIVEKSRIAKDTAKNVAKSSYNLAKDVVCIQKSNLMDAFLVGKQAIEKFKEGIHTRAEEIRNKQTEFDDLDGYIATTNLSIRKEIRTLGLDYDSPEVQNAIETVDRILANMEPSGNEANHIETRAKLIKEEVSKLKADMENQKSANPIDKNNEEILTEEPIKEPVQTNANESFQCADGSLLTFDGSNHNITISINGQEIRMEISQKDFEKSKAKENVIEKENSDLEI